MRISYGQREGDRKECHSQPDGKLRQNMRGLCAKDVLGHGTSKSGSETLAARKLHQND
jgi:hypothetical protein